MITHLSTTRKINPEKFVLIRNWQNDDNFTGLPVSELTTSFTFMYLGNISASAGVELLIKAFHISNIPKSKLIIAGDGADKDKCQELAKNLKNDQIFFLRAPVEEVPRLQSEADILLLPLKKGVSLTASPSKLTAYMLSGRPIVACVEQDSDTALNILNCNGGFVSAPGNVEELSRIMLLTSIMPRRELSAMGRNAREFAENNLSRAANLKKVNYLVETIGNGNQEG